MPHVKFATILTNTKDDKKVDLPFAVNQGGGAYPVINSRIFGYMVGLLSPC